MISINSPFYNLYRAGYMGQTNVDFDIQRDNTYRFNVIHLVESGQGTLFYKGKQFELKKGQIFLLPAYEGHNYYSDTKNPMKLSWFEFYGSESKSVMDKIISKNTPILNIDNQKEFSDIIKEMYNLFITNVDEPLSILIYKTLFGLYKKYITEEIMAIIDKNINSVIEYIDMNLDKNLTLKNLIKISGYSESYFSKKFKKILKVTPSKYILYKRIVKAKEYLINTDKRLSEITDELGFYNSTHFIKKFKELEGCTPILYRKNSQYFS